MLSLQEYESFKMQIAAIDAQLEKMKKGEIWLDFDPKDNYQKR